MAVIICWFVLYITLCQKATKLEKGLIQQDLRLLPKNTVRLRTPVCQLRTKISKSKGYSSDAVFGVINKKSSRLGELKLKGS
ncbi:hypothetical protein B0E43_00270 [Algoriphagus sp. A40]|nr:hypothetical protein B0E43_00270 [Algoriphagus sp. A40]